MSLRSPLATLAAALACCSLVGCPGGSSASAGGKALSGTYQAKSAEGTMTLVFKAGNKVKVIMADKGSPPDESDADYMVNGDQVTVQITGGIPMTLTNKGKVLEGDFAAQILRFEKK